MPRCNGPPETGFNGTAAGPGPATMGDGRIAARMTVFAQALGVFAMNSTIALELDRLGVFDENDVLFQADPPCRLSSLAHGWCERGRGYVHPRRRLHEAAHVTRAAAPGAASR